MSVLDKALDLIRKSFTDAEFESLTRDQQQRTIEHALELAKGGPGSGRKKDQFVQAHWNLSPRAHLDSARKIALKFKDKKTYTQEQLGDMYDRVKWHKEEAKRKKGE